MTTPAPELTSMWIPPPPPLSLFAPPSPARAPLSPEDRVYINKLLDKLERSQCLTDTFDVAADIFGDENVDWGVVPVDVVDVIRRLKDLHEPWRRACAILEESEDEKTKKRIKELETEIASGERAIEAIKRQRQELYMIMDTSEKREDERIKRARSELESLTSTS